MNQPGVQYKAMAGPGELLGATLDGVGTSGVASVRAVVATLGRLDADGTSADLKVNLAIPQARAWWEAFKFDLEHPPALQQWSHGYTVKAGGSFDGRFGGRPVRFLQPLADGFPGVVVHEVGPVMLGSGVDTSTLEVSEPAALDDPGPDMAREYARFVRSTLEAA